MSPDEIAAITAAGGPGEYCLRLLSSLRPSDGDKLTFVIGDTQVTFNKEIICSLSPFLSSLLQDINRDGYCCANGQVFISLPPEMSPTAVLSLQTVLQNGVIHHLDGPAREQVKEALDLLGINIKLVIIQENDNHEANVSSQLNETRDLGMWDLDDEDDYFDVNDIKIENISEYTEISTDFLHDYEANCVLEEQSMASAVDMVTSYVNSFHRNDHEDLVQTSSGDAKNSEEMTEIEANENDRNNNNGVFLEITKKCEASTANAKGKQTTNPSISDIEHTQEKSDLSLVKLDKSKTDHDVSDTNMSLGDSLHKSLSLLSPGGNKLETTHDRKSLPSDSSALYRSPDLSLKPVKSMKKKEMSTRLRHKINQPVQKYFKRKVSSESSLSSSEEISNLETSGELFTPAPGMYNFQRVPCKNEHEIKIATTKKFKLASSCGIKKVKVMRLDRKRMTRKCDVKVERLDMKRFEGIEDFDGRSYLRSSPSDGTDISSKIVVQTRDTEGDAMYDLKRRKIAVQTTETEGDAMNDIERKKIVTQMTNDIEREDKSNINSTSQSSVATQYDVTVRHPEASTSSNETSKSWEVGNVDHDNTATEHIIESVETIDAFEYESEVDCEDLNIIRLVGLVISNLEHDNFDNIEDRDDLDPRSNTINAFSNDIVDVIEEEVALEEGGDRSDTFTSQAFVFEQNSFLEIGDSEGKDFDPKSTKTSASQNDRASHYDMKDLGVGSDEEDIEKQIELVPKINIKRSLGLEAWWVQKPYSKGEKFVRKPYKMDEDERIFRYMKKNQLHGRQRGNKIWQRMEEENVCEGRSWQSMKERWIKQLYNKHVHANKSKTN